MTTDVQSKPPPLREPPRLGEELPIFCERCGYSLHGLAQARCDHCEILQFHCPECGHHQPINTLRPAAQTLLGRIRGGWLTLVILFKLNLIGWSLFAWVAIGATYSYRYDWQATQSMRQTAQKASPNSPGPFIAMWKPGEIDLESLLAFTLYGLAFGMVLRMALLRWKRGWAVGLVLGSLAMLSIWLGVVIRQLDLGNQKLDQPYTASFLTLMGMAFATILMGAMIVWGIWTLLVQAFLPKPTATSLLNWQRSLSNQVSALVRPERREPQMNTDEHG